MTWLFGYGSLLFEPELPDHVVERRPARLTGLCRQFNKISRARGHGETLSLVLGTEPGAHIDGMLVGYPQAIARTLMARMAIREGDGYVPRQVEIDGVAATTWVSLPHGRWYAGVLPLEEQARRLVAATPPSPGPRARGVRYLYGVQQALAEAGLTDPYLDELAAYCSRIVTSSDGAAM